MDYSEWMIKALNSIRNLQNGTLFTVKQLFEGVEWNRLRKGDRIQFGKYFKNEVELGKVHGVVYSGKAVNNSTQYIKSA